MSSPHSKNVDGAPGAYTLKKTKATAEYAAGAAPSSRGSAKVCRRCPLTMQSSVHLQPQIHGNLGEGGDGFTLLEVLMVIAIMLIIVAIALPRITPMLEAAHKTTIVAKMRTLTNELSAYRMNCGGYPNSLAALKPSPEKGCSKSSAAASDPTTASGYRLTYAATNPDDNIHYEGYTLSAVPSSSGSAAGNESYFTDQTGIIRVHRNSLATISDPPLVP